MWDLPRPGIEPVSTVLAGRFLNSGPPGKSLKYFWRWSWQAWLANVGDEEEEVSRRMLSGWLEPWGDGCTLCWEGDNFERRRFWSEDSDNGLNVVPFDSLTVVPEASKLSSFLFIPFYWFCSMLVIYAILSSSSLIYSFCLSYSSSDSF